MDLMVHFVESRDVGVATLVESEIQRHDIDRSDLSGFRRRLERFAPGAPLTDVGCRTVYAPGPHGYTDYPAFRWAAAG
jgi:hypothetical protein